MAHDDKEKPLTPPEAIATEISECSRYARYSIKSHVFSGIQRELSLDTKALDIKHPWTINELVQWCMASGVSATQAESTLSRLRSDAFSIKYRGYSYDADLRGLAPHWHQELLDILGHRRVTLEDSVVLDVGAGDAHEMAFLFGPARRAIAADVSRELLDACTDPHVELVCNAAENLVDIPDSSIDLYVSLRTYQSSLFDVAGALREAFRVLKTSGTILISIADGFVECEDGRLKVVRGLLRPGSHSAVDRDAPHELAELIRYQLERTGFHDIRHSHGTTDLYLSGERA